LRILIEDGKAREEQTSNAIPSTSFYPGRTTTAIDAGPAPESETPRTAMGHTGSSVHIISSARVLDAGPAPESLIELIKSTRSGLSSMSVNPNKKVNALDAGKAQL
jgi:hypothetical protein